MLVGLLSVVTGQQAAAMHVLPLSSVEVIFDANAEDGHVGSLDGESVRTKEIDTIGYGASVEAVQAYRPLYIFLGWYTDPWGGERVTAESTEVVTHLYARWECGFDVTNRQLDFTKVFFNECKSGEYSTYNLGTCRLFADSNNKNSWCSDSALVDLMNRALAYDGLVAEDYFFDLRDILMGNCNNTGWISRLSVYRSPRGKSTYSNAGYSGGEKLNYDYHSESKTLTFTNTYGSHGVNPKTYTVTFDYALWNSRWRNVNKEYLQRLLAKHPEGLWVQVDHRAKTGSHCYMIVGYDEEGFLYIDNGNADPTNGSTGIVRFNGLYDQNYRSEDDMLNNYVLTVGYVNR